jgi:peptidoglycan/LPS O-acetylase OafA/YrhL
MSVQGQFYIGFLALIFSFAYLFRERLGKNLRLSLVVLLSSLTIASFVYAILLHADQATAYYNSFARAWELLRGAPCSAPWCHRALADVAATTVAVVALAAILSCGALIDGVRSFPGRGRWCQSAPTMLFILSAANRQADRAPRPTARPQPVAGHGAVRVARGRWRTPLYLWHWPLLIFWLPSQGGPGQLPRGRGRAADAQACSPG